MVFASVRELKARASEFIREARKNGGVVVVSHGKPTAALIPLDGESFEDYLLEYNPRLRNEIEGSFREHAAGGGTSVGKLIEKARKDLKRSR